MKVIYDGDLPPFVFNYSYANYFGRGADHEGNNMSRYINWLGRQENQERLLQEYLQTNKVSLLFRISDELFTDES